RYPAPAIGLPDPDRRRIAVEEPRLIRLRPQLPAAMRPDVVLAGGHVPSRGGCRLDRHLAAEVRRGTPETTPQSRFFRSLASAERDVAIARAEGPLLVVVRDVVAIVSRLVPPIDDRPWRHAIRGRGVGDLRYRARSDRQAVDAEDPREHRGQSCPPDHDFHRRRVRIRVNQDVDLIVADGAVKDLVEPRVLAGEVLCRLYGV